MQRVNLGSGDLESDGSRSDRIRRRRIRMRDR